MTNKKLSLFSLVPLAGVIALAGCASSTSRNVAAPSPYAQAQSGQVRSGNGGCVQTGTWTNTSGECEPRQQARIQPAELPPPTTATAESVPPEENVAQAPPAEPAEVPAAPATQRVFVGADTYFAFDKAELTPKARASRDKLVERARNGQEPTVQIAGYADQIGSPDYNLQLSQRRADAVRTYLVDQGLSEDAIRLDARGETDPVVRCQGRQGNQLIQCLQPNRRTEVLFSALEEVEQQR